MPEIKKLRKEIQDLTSKRDRLVGERSSLSKRLSEKYGLKSLDDVEEHLAKLKEQADELAENVTAGLNKLKESIGW